AGRVDQHAAHRPQALEVADGHAERGDQYHIRRRHRREIELPRRVMSEDGNAELFEPAIHVWVVDDLADEVDALLGKLAARLVRVLHRTVYAVTEAELLRQPERQVAHYERVVLGAQPVHQPAVIRRHVVRDGVLEAEALPEIGLIHA